MKLEAVVAQLLSTYPWLIPLVVVSLVILVAIPIALLVHAYLRSYLKGHTFRLWGIEIGAPKEIMTDTAPRETAYDKSVEYNVRLLVTADQWYQEAIDVMKGAKIEIYDASLTCRFGEGDYWSDTAAEYYNCRNAIIRANEVEYKYLAVFTSPKDRPRLIMVKNWKDQFKTKNILIRWYRMPKNSRVDHSGQATQSIVQQSNSKEEAPVPLLNLLIVDNKEILIGLFYPGESERTLHIVNRSVADLFVKYFMYFWNISEPLNRGPGTDDRIREIENIVGPPTDGTSQ